MKRTGAWLVRYALEQIGVRYTFGIPGVHNTELYDELSQSDKVQPVLVTHEAGGSFMADAISRTSSHIGTLLIVPAAGTAYASAGMGEARLAGVPMLVISGGIRTDIPYQFQLHQIDQLNFVGEITKQAWRITRHHEIVPAIFEAYRLATEGEPGPVFVEIPVNILLFMGEVDYLPTFEALCDRAPVVESSQIDKAVEMLLRAKNPCIFVGWGAREATEWVMLIAEFLDAPVATTLQGLSVFPGNHPLHVGMGFGPASVPAAENAFRHCDCMLAIGTRFAEIPTGSFGSKVPENLIHLDINPEVFHANYPAKVVLKGDAAQVTEALWQSLQKKPAPTSQRMQVREQIRRDKQQYLQSWLAHDSGGKVNPAHFFGELRQQMKDDDFLVADDGNHTFLVAELMPIHKSGHMISPTDFNCMGYAVPAVIGTKLANPAQQVVGIVGDGAFTMTCMEILTATRLKIGVIFFVFHDGELAQIAQAQALPYNRKTCTQVDYLDVSGVAKATGARFLALEHNEECTEVMEKAFRFANEGKPVVVDVRIDYSRRTRFTEGIVGTNLKRFTMGTKARFIGRALVRRVTG